MVAMNYLVDIIGTYGEKYIGNESLIKIPINFVLIQINY